MSTKELEKAAEAAASPSPADSISMHKSVDDDDAPPPPPVALTAGATVTDGEYRTETEKQIASGEYKHPFKWSSLWSPEIVNPLNQKSYTIPLLYVFSPYSIAFWMATLGFFVAFLSWFAFSPLTPETVKADLHLTSAEVANSNITALSATLLVRLVAGPLVDRFGPRKVMAGILVLGAIPSGLAGLAHNAGSLYAIRFFIGILGGTFVPCQAWVVAFFDKSVVGTAQAMAGGWGNMGGGVTFAVQTGLFQRLLKDGLKQHIAWRVCFVIVPVPVLLFSAGLMMLIAKDHPMGRWANRHETPATAAAILMGADVQLDADERRALQQRDPEKVRSEKAARAVIEPANPSALKPIDVAVNEPLSLSVVKSVVLDMRTWMLAFTYATTFGFELALDAALANSLYALFKSKTFHQLDAGYLGSTYGLLNLFMRLLGGLGSDMLYARYGLYAKKYWMHALAILQGLFAIGLGMLIDHGHITVGKFMGFVVLLALSGFAANGAVYGLVPHLNSRSNGVMTGTVGAFGNLGGIIYSLIFRFQPAPLGKPYWVSGIFCTVLNVLLVAIPLGDAA